MGRWKRLGRGGLAAGLLVLASEVVFVTRTEPISGMPVFAPTADHLVLAANRQLLDRTPGRVVLVGDSSCKMGLVPADIEEVSGYPVVNLGTVVNMTPAGFADLAAEAMERDPPPRAIVLASLPMAYAVTYEQAVEWDMLGRYLIAYGRKSEVYTPTAAEYWSWFYLKHRMNIVSPDYPGGYKGFLAALEKTDGFWPEKQTYTGTKVKKEHFAGTEFARKSIHVLVRTATEKNVPVFLWVSPSPADAVTDEYVAGVNAFLTDLRRTEPRLHVLQDAMPVWETKRFGSVTHLIPEEARHNSRLFATVMKDALGPR